jgi:hypothetical protein
MVCVKWRYTVDFDIIAFLAIWRTERNGSSESTRAIRSSKLKSPADSGTGECLFLWLIRETSKHISRPSNTDNVLLERAVNFVRDGELGPFRFVEENDDRAQVNHLALTYRF